MDWKSFLLENVTSASELKDLMGLTDEQASKLDDILERYPMSVTKYYLGLVDWDDYQNDPIYRQCVPSIEETDMSGSFDTSGEASNTKQRGLQHKYHETALVLSTQKCAMYCRHCFRKRLVGINDQEETAPDPKDIAAYVKEHKEISNVLISGGDAFLNDNSVIKSYLEELSAIDHLDLIRFGSRTPVTFPMRIYGDAELLEMLKEYSEKKKIYVVTHFNHPKEITPESKLAVKKLEEAGVIVRNQTVFMRGINDDPAVLSTLLKGITAIGVIPYYVFQCRPVTGVKQQFQVPILEAYEIIEKAKSLQNGQGKGLRYVMSHVTGKIEFIGPDGSGNMIMKYHQAKYDKDQGRIFTVKLDKDQCWIDKVPE